MKIYCVTHKEINGIEKLGLIPFGVGKNKFPEHYKTEQEGQNISEKNYNYSETSFHYWYWKNLLKYKKDNEWVGFCSYREYWGNNKNNDSKKLNDLVLKDYNADWSKYDAIIGKPLFVGGTKITKVLKYGKMALIRNPSAIFSKKGRSIRWQFEMFHGIKKLDLLNPKSKKFNQLRNRLL